MTEDRREWDARIRNRSAVCKIATDLGLRGTGKHFFCPGCQPEGAAVPELVIQDGGFQCFRCGAVGDVVGLVKLARGCDLESAINWLATETGEKGEPDEGD